ncbi:MAG: glycosyltransferase [Candidatus Kaiserbacteria bacterium]|nr:glycosyltransferase [Candidatus Kaiserbacteria bacterium]
MRILYVAAVRMPTEKAHGLQIMKMCEAYTRLGHEVTLVVPDRENVIREDPFAYYAIKTRFGIEKLRAPEFIPYDMITYWWHRLVFAFAAWRFTRQARCDVIHTRDELIALFLSFGGTPYIFEVHEGRWNMLMRRAARKARSMPVLTHGLAAYFAAHGVAPHKLMVSPDAVDLGDFAHPESRESSRARLNLPKEKKIALYIGLIDAWKGTDTFFAASAHVPDDILLAVIGGKDDQIAPLKTKYPKVLFLGSRPYRELANNQSAADVLVLPNSGKHAISSRDTSPLKLFTYMASGRAIVASDLPSLREVLDERTAEFFTPDDADSLARAIARVLENAAHADSLARAAREKVTAYTWEARAEHIIEAIL